jgi:putative hydrolase of the HAD superfamily
MVTTAEPTSYRAVIFDLGGVVVGSPLAAIARYERDHGFTPGTINRVVVETGPGGAWSRLERGEIGLEEFYLAFDRECAAAGSAISARTLMERIAAITAPRPVMLTAVRRIRARGLATAALTNNWVTEEEGVASVHPHFDVVVESAAVGLRKPDPRIYRLACERLGVEPPQAVFLDDIGANLKPARALGMTPIRVTDPEAAVDELARVLGFPLREP